MYSLQVPETILLTRDGHNISTANGKSRIFLYHSFTFAWQFTQESRSLNFLLQNFLAYYKRLFWCLYYPLQEVIFKHQWVLLNLVDLNHRRISLGLHLDLVVVCKCIQQSALWKRICQKWCVFFWQSSTHWKRRCPSISLVSVWLETIWPRYCTSSWKKWNFFGLSFRSEFLSIWNTF